jgi:hypothetical protein
MKLVIAGGTGQIGHTLRHYLCSEAEIVTIARHGADVTWDGETVGPWASELEGADAVINLSGKSVNCRYNPENLKELFDSRIKPTIAIGEAIEKCKNPPKVWLQSSSATLYSHRFDAPNDDENGIFSGHEPGFVARWHYSIDLIQAWEKALFDANTPNTRKVAMRISIVVGAGSGGIFDKLATVAKYGLGGPIGDGRQMVSWIHEEDLASAVMFLIRNENMEGPLIVAGPGALPNKEFNEILRDALHAKIGLPLPKFLVRPVMWIARSEPELLLKSRYVKPSKLISAGFEFKYPEWSAAATELASRWR